MRKTMRKSALLSSVAMLIVSAIVLTSATYAWFSASKHVEVSEITAAVETSTGLLISIDDGKSWKTTVDVSSKVPTVFSPVSTAVGTSWTNATYDKGNLEFADVAEGTYYLKYNLWVKGPANDPIIITPTFTFGSGENDADVKKSAKFALYDVDNSKFYESKIVAADGTAAAYTGIYAADGTKVAVSEDSNAAYIYSGTDASVTKASGISEAAALPDLTLSTNNQIRKFVAYVWVEGNDADCVADNISAESFKFKLEMDLTSAKTGA